jgi:pantetheine-phosphate adenylyltransferase
MKKVFIYPGSFCPPTYGHLQILKRAAQIFPYVYVVCSINPDKQEKFFSPDECKELWQTYRLPHNCSVITLAELLAKKINPKKITMIRGLRDSSDFEFDKTVMANAVSDFGITSFHYILSAQEYRNCSSTRARRAAETLSLRSLSKLVSPLVVSTLLEKTLKVKNIFLVVGQPASGESTILRSLAEQDERFQYINSDGFHETLLPLIRKKFGDDDLIQIAINQERELKRLIGNGWLKMLTDELKKAKEGSIVLVENAYGLQPTKKVYRFIGGRIVVFDCGDAQESKKRLIARQTPQMIPFIKLIPDFPTALCIAEQEHLQISRVKTEGDLAGLTDKIEVVKNNLQGGKLCLNNLPGFCLDI